MVGMWATRRMLLMPRQFVWRISLVAHMLEDVAEPLDGKPISRPFMDYHPRCLVRGGGVRLPACGKGPRRRPRRVAPRRFSAGAHPFPGRAPRAYDVRCAGPRYGKPDGRLGPRWWWGVNLDDDDNDNDNEWRERVRPPPRPKSDRVLGCGMPPP